MTVTKFWFDHIDIILLNVYSRILNVVGWGWITYMIKTTESQVIKLDDIVYETNNVLVSRLNEQLYLNRF